MFLEPVLPAPRVLVVGDTPIAEARRRASAPSSGSTSSRSTATTSSRAPATSRSSSRRTAATSCTALRRGLEAGLPYVGLVASRKRGDGRARRAARRRRARRAARAHRRARRARHRRAHAGRDRALDPGRGSSRCAAPTRHRLRPPWPRRRRSHAAPLAVDPICGMTVAAAAGTPSLEHDGETVYFCCEGCKATFAARARPCRRRGLIRA